MFRLVKKRCGIPDEIDAYDSDIRTYLADCMDDMRASGVPNSLLDPDDINPQTATAATLYVKAYLGDDRTDSEKYLDLYRKKVFRLTLEDDSNADNDNSTTD